MSDRIVEPRLSPGERRVALAIAGLAFVFRVPLLLEIALHPMNAVSPNDSAYYWAQGLLLAHGGSYDGTLWAWGYPLLLSFLDTHVAPSPVVVVILQVCASSLTAVAVMILGRRLGGQRCGVVSGVIYGLTPIVALLSVQVMSDVLASALVAWAMVCVLAAADGARAGRWRLAASAGAGALLGLAANLSNYPKYFGLLTALWLAASAFRERRLAPIGRGVALVAAMALILLPWTLRNEARWGVTSTTQESGNLLICIAVEVVAADEGVSDDVVGAQLVQRLEEDGLLDGSGASLPPHERLDAGVWSHPERNGAFEKLALQLIMQHPMGVVRYFPRAMIGFAAGGELKGRGYAQALANHVRSGGVCPLSHPECLLAAGYNALDDLWLFVLGFGAALGIVLAAWRGIGSRSVLALVGVLLLYLYASHVATAIARCRVRTVPFEAPAVAAGIEVALRRASRRRRPVDAAA